MKEMSNVLKDVQLLEKDLMRDLTNEEIAAVINKGWEKFLAEDLKFNQDEFQAMLKIREIISSFCSRDQDAYDKALEGDISSAYLVLEHILEDMNDKLEKCSTNPHCSTQKEKECETIANVANTMSEVLDSLPAKSNKWLREYIKMDPDYSEMIDLVTKYVTDDRGEYDEDYYSFDELCGDVSDHIKDTVIKGIADKLLANKGKAIVLDTEILDEVFDYLLNTNQNIKVRAVNNQITVL